MSKLSEAINLLRCASINCGNIKKIGFVMGDIIKSQVDDAIQLLEEKEAPAFLAEYFKIKAELDAARSLIDAAKSIDPDLYPVNDTNLRSDDTSAFRVLRSALALRKKKMAI